MIARAPFLARPGDRSRTRVLSVLAVGALSLVAQVALAAPKPGETEALVASLAADTAHADAVKAPLEKAKNALDRAKAMERAGDSVHAGKARALAREWTEVARDAVRAADAEARAVKAEKTLDDLQTKTVRGRALVEETIARRGRARELLEQLEAERAAEKAAPKKPEPEKPKKQKAATGAPKGDE